MQIEKFESWGLVEVMGHKQFAGYVSEVVVAGQGFVRVQVPKVGDQQPFEKLIGTSSIYAITPLGEQAARAMAAGLREEPIQAWELPTVRQVAGPTDDPDDLDGHGIETCEDES